MAKKLITQQNTLATVSLVIQMEIGMKEIFLMEFVKEKENITMQIKITTKENLRIIKNTEWGNYNTQ